MSLDVSTDPRAIEILKRIKAVFAQKGFDGASMQDLARAAEISAGNFYRYFSSKDAIIEAMVGHDLADVGALFHQVLSSPDPRATFLDVLRAELVSHCHDCDGPMWAEIEAASARRPEIAQICDRMDREVAHYLFQTFALIGDTSIEEAATRFQHHAALIMILFKGVAMQQNPGHALIDLTLVAVDGLLDDVVARAPALPRQDAVAAKD